MIKDNIKQKAIFAMLAAAFCLSIIQLAVKMSGSSLTLAQQLFSRNFFTLLLSIFYVKKEKVLFFGQKENRLVMCLRAIFGLIGLWLYFYASKQLIIADATIANKTSPLFAAVFGVVLLKQRLSLKQWLCLGIGFAGVVFMIRPQFDFDIIPFLIAVLGAAFSALGYTVISFLKGREKKSTIIFVNGFVSCLVLIPFVDFSFLKMDFYQLGFLAIIGVTSAVGQVFLTYAYNNNFTGEVSLYNYFGIVFSAVLGYIFLRETISIYSLIGMAILVLSAIGMYKINNKTKVTEVYHGKE